MKVSLQSTAQLNQTDSGEPLPVIVRVYQLRSREKFDHGNFQSFWKADKQLLETDMLDRKELTVYPESKAVVELEVDDKKGTEFLGVVALFRKPEGDSWKKILPAQKRKTKLVLDRYTIKQD